MSQSCPEFMQVASDVNGTCTRVCTSGYSRRRSYTYLYILFSNHFAPCCRKFMYDTLFASNASRPISIIAIDHVLNYMYTFVSESCHLQCRYAQLPSPPLLSSFGDRPVCAG